MDTIQGCKLNLLDVSTIDGLSQSAAAADSSQITERKESYENNDCYPVAVRSVYR